MAADKPNLHSVYKRAYILSLILMKKRLKYVPHPLSGAAGTQENYIISFMLEILLVLFPSHSLIKMILRITIILKTVLPVPIK